MKKVFLGIGHGGTDTGACANGLREKDINLVIGTECAAVLHRHGVEVLMSRTGDVSEKLDDKIRRCNAFKPDLAADIHNNAGGGDGAECFHHYKGGRGKTLSENILKALGAIGQNSRGAKTKRNVLGKDWYAFIRNTNDPAIIVECAFLDHKEDVKFVDTIAEQKAVGLALAKGFLETLGIAFVEEKSVDTETKDNSKLYRVQVGAYSVRKNAENLVAKLKKDGYDAIIV